MKICKASKCVPGDRELDALFWSVFTLIAYLGPRSALLLRRAACGVRTYLQCDRHGQDEMECGLKIELHTASTVLRANMHKFCMQDRLLPAVSLTEYVLLHDIDFVFIHTSDMYHESMTTHMRSSHVILCELRYCMYFQFVSSACVAMFVY